MYKLIFFFNFIIFKIFFIKNQEHFEQKNINGYLQNKVELDVYNYIV